jgi:hypothetical protein
MSKFAFANLLFLRQKLRQLHHLREVNPLPQPLKPSRSSLPAAERQLRSRLIQLISGSQGLVRGTLSVRERSCGKSNCRCARGEKHSSLYLVVSMSGKYKQICVSRSREADVRIWVAQYQELQELIETVSKVYLAKLQNREE